MSHKIGVWDLYHLIGFSIDSYRFLEGLIVTTGSPFFMHRDIYVIIKVAHL